MACFPLSQPSITSPESLKGLLVALVSTSADPKPDHLWPWGRGPGSLPMLVGTILCVCVASASKGVTLCPTDRFKTFSRVDSDGNSGTLAKALIHPLWFCFRKVLDQAINHSSVITVLVCSAFNCPFQRERLHLLHLPQIIVIIMQCWTGF